MLTSLGRHLRKMRIDNGELLKDMAVKLDMSPAMLSSVENGKRNPPSDLIGRLQNVYKLGVEEVQELTHLVAESSESVSIGLKGMKAPDQHLAFSFARRFATLSDDEKERIKEVLDETNKSD